mmetsp:Transcript_10060/g.16961  ORF Transcript_10060/g.16961 Transcript_10060/m.16961 type:complete len:90 (+) Transcript_10060:75-344(+)
MSQNSQFAPNDHGNNYDPSGYSQKEHDYASNMGGSQHSRLAEQPPYIDVEIPCYEEIQNVQQTVPIVHEFVSLPQNQDISQAYEYTQRY